MQPDPKNPASGDGISLFPLPSTVFYPKTHLPLHIFEPRYRQMISEALEGEGRIGMVLLKPGWEENYHASPAIVEVGCVGMIEHHIRFPDGKYDLVLRGQNRFRIVREFGGKPYRRAAIETLKDSNDVLLGSGPSPAVTALLQQVRRYAEALPAGKKPKQIPGEESFPRLGELVDNLAYALNLLAEQRQVLLEEQDVMRRTEILTALLQEKIAIVARSKNLKARGADVRLN